MPRPVLSSVWSQRKVFDVVSVNVIVQSEKNTDACLCKNRMCGLEFNVIGRDVSHGLSKSVRRQEFPDGEMRELNDPRVPVVDYGDQTRAGRHYCLFLILPAPILV